MTIRGKMCVLVGGQYGSEGKGAIAAHVADDYDVHVRVGSPNAGHTIWWGGEKHVMQTIPCGWVNPRARIVIGRGALVNMRLLVQELEHIQQYYPDFRKRLYIDAQAGVLDERFHEMEGGTEGEMHRRIGSTGEGVGPARMARISRDPDQFRLFESVVDEYGLEDVVCYDTPTILATLQDAGWNVLIEGTQGSGLSLYHSCWPYCTSVDTNAAGIIAEVGIAPTRVTDVLMVCRTYPIRVAGNSGPMQGEITWEDLAQRIGATTNPSGIGRVFTPERTTVTHKVRRIAEWDDELFEKSCLLNAPTEIALTFCDYIDPDIAGTSSMFDIDTSGKLFDFMQEHGLLGRIRYFGTGPKTVAEVV